MLVYLPLFHLSAHWPRCEHLPCTSYFIQANHGPCWVEASHHTPTLQLMNPKLNFSRLSLLTISPRPSDSSDAKSSPFFTGAEASSGGPLSTTVLPKARFLKEITQNDMNVLGLSSHRVNISQDSRSTSNREAKPKWSSTGADSRFDLRKLEVDVGVRFSVG